MHPIDAQTRGSHPRQPSLQAVATILISTVMIGFTGCSAPTKPTGGAETTSATPPAVPADPNQLGFEQARAMFASRGPQPGDRLPPLSLVDLDGKPVSITTLQDGQPMVIVTASLTCNVARRQQAEADAMRATFAATASANGTPAGSGAQGGADVAVVVIYTIDAHPKGDPCPHTGEEWVPKSNERDEVLVRQPTDLAGRLALARDYATRFTSGTTVVVDTMDNASWIALGQAPNLGLVVDRDGVIRLRQEWFDRGEVEGVVAGW